ncbi:hypothetical protein B0J13DRAFT_530839 [Dactylonectria estremocensis]|uniref:Uncharacterized protein n=1 Tax=Dactylonectria estremocensis TaxID=1079267 RepID=A0A9P9DWE4_9HYPO|nr:hypothetical protein B0J13DRAFT_530839 [Dactylonectria estremocensis]
MAWAWAWAGKAGSLHSTLKVSMSRGGLVSRWWHGSVMVSRVDTEMAKKCTETEAGSNPCWDIREGRPLRPSVALCSRGSMRWNGCCNSRIRRRDGIRRLASVCLVTSSVKHHTPPSSFPRPRLKSQMPTDQGALGTHPVSEWSMSESRPKRKRKDQKNKKNKTGRPGDSQSHLPSPSEGLVRSFVVAIRGSTTARAGHNFNTSFLSASLWSSLVQHCASSTGLIAHSPSFIGLSSGSHLALVVLSPRRDRVETTPPPPTLTTATTTATAAAAAAAVAIELPQASTTTYVPTQPRFAGPTPLYVPPQAPSPRRRVINREKKKNIPAGAFHGGAAISPRFSHPRLTLTRTVSLCLTAHPSPITIWLNRDQE